MPTHEYASINIEVWSIEQIISKIVSKYRNIMSAMQIKQFWNYGKHSIVSSINGSCM